MAGTTTSASDLYDDGRRPSRQLRIAIVTHGTSVPPWVNYILSHVMRLDCIKVVAVITLPQSMIEAPAPPLVKLYGLIDRLSHPQRLGHRDILQPLSVSGELPVIEPDLSAGASTRVSELALDVALCLGLFDDCKRIGEWATLGAWYLEFGDDRTLTSWPGRTIVDREPKTTISLKAAQVNESLPKTLFHAVGATQGNLWCSENLHWTYLKAAGIIGRCLRQAARVEDVLVEPRSIPELPRQGPPDTVEMATFLTGALTRSQRYRMLSRRFNEQWVLGVRPHVEPSSVPGPDGFNLIAPPDTSFYADPFPIRVDGRTWVFFEELPFDTGKGHISYMLLDPAGRPEAVGRALELEYHLSYPFVFAFEDQIYMIPESAAANAVELFRAERFPDRWVRVSTLLQGYPMVDATLHREGHLWFMFVNVSETGGRLDDELFLFVAEQPFGPWRPHPGNPIKSDASCARSAGPIFRAGGKLMRPSQDSIGGYGQAIVFSEIVRLSATEYLDQPIGRIEPEWAPSLNGCHHFASDGVFDVIDGRRFHPKPRAAVGEGVIRRET